MEEQKKTDLLNDDYAKKERRAGSQEEKIKRFFAGLNASTQRRMRSAQEKVTGRKETAAEMMARLSRSTP